ncbi:MAG: right-handed parallel beta-helix repeat-containing protein [Planctomycetes bacterium]|nr:right-handed parallel beta-helix repeat-containing protein [Planctomycetota bacterium]
MSCTGGGGSKPGGSGSGNGSASDVGADVGLSSAVAGDGEVRVFWDAVDVDGTDLDVALFQSIDPDAVYSGAPVASGLGAGSATLTGLANGTKIFLGLALDDGAGGYTPVGTVFSARPNPPIYVRAGADPNLADGLSPATAFPEPQSGILTAFAHGGGNVWIATGDYLDQALPLWSRVDLYGGFASDFSLATRDPAAQPSRLHGKNPFNLFTLNDGDTGVVLDGLELVGDGLGVIGFESQDTPCELRSLVVRGMKGRGLKVASAIETLVFDARVVDCVVEANGADGLFVQGAIQLTVERSRFVGNAQEGCEAGLIAPDGERIVVGVRGSQFADNGFEGLKLNLKAPIAPTFPASFDIALEGSSFERNRQKAGLLLDIDFNLIAGWSMDLVLRGCLARNNEADGVQLQLDSTSTTLIQGLVASGNGGDGLQVSSQSTPSHAVVAASVFSGNRGYGVLAENGNVPVLASHSLFTGNSLGGFASPDVTSTVVSSVAALQTNAFSGVTQHHTVTENDPDAPLFVRTPREFRGVDTTAGSKLVLTSLGDLAVGDRIEFADDGVERTLSSIGPGTQVALSPALDAFLVPSSLGRFAPGVAVDEDWHVVAGSVAEGAAMIPTGGAAVDAGPLSAPGVVTPGVLAALPPTRFFVSSVSPRLDQALGANDTIELTFLGSTLDASSADASHVRALDGAGTALAVQLLSVGDQLHVAAPAGGWPSGTVRLELHAGLAAQSGDELAAPTLLVYSVP